MQELLGTPHATAVQRAQVGSAATTKPAGPQGKPSLGSYIGVINAVQEFAVAAIDQGGNGLDTVRLVPELGPAHHTLLAKVKAVLIEGQASKEKRATAAGEWPALSAKVKTVLDDAKRAGCPKESVAAAVTCLGLLGTDYLHVQTALADEIETYPGVGDAIQAMHELLWEFSHMGEGSEGLVREDVPGRSDAPVSAGVRALNQKQRDAINGVKFGAHLIKRHARLLGTLRTTLLLARSEAPGSAYKAWATWKTIAGDLDGLVKRSKAFGIQDVSDIQGLMTSTAETLTHHYQLVHQSNIGVALSEERKPEQVAGERMAAKAGGPAVAAALAERGQLRDFRHALGVVQHGLTPIPDRPGEWLLTSGQTRIRVREEQVIALRANVGKALRDYMAHIVKVMVGAWQNYDSIKRGNSSFKLHVLGGLGGADDPGSQDAAKNEAIKWRDKKVYPLVEEGKFVEAFDLVMIEKDDIDAHVRAVNAYDEDLDSGYSRLSTAMAVVQAGLMALVPAAGAAAAAEYGVVVVAGTAVGTGVVASGTAEATREVVSGEGPSVRKIAGASFQGGVIGLGAIAPGATKAIGGVLAAGETTGVTVLVADTSASMLVSGTQNAVGGGSFTEGALGAGVGHLGGEAVKGLGSVGENAFVKTTGGALAGGVASKASGGEFWVGAAGGGVGSVAGMAGGPATAGTETTQPDGPTTTTLPETPAAPTATGIAMPPLAAPTAAVVAGGAGPASGTQPGASLLSEPAPAGPVASRPVPAGGVRSDNFYEVDAESLLAPRQAGQPRQVWGEGALRGPLGKNDPTKIMFDDNLRLKGIMSVTVADHADVVNAPSADLSTKNPGGAGSVIPAGVGIKVGTVDESGHPIGDIKVRTHAFNPNAPADSFSRANSTTQVEIVGHPASSSTLNPDTATFGPRTAAEAHMPAGDAYATAPAAGPAPAGWRYRVTQDGHEVVLVNGRPEDEHGNPRVENGDGMVKQEFGPKGASLPPDYSPEEWMSLLDPWLKPMPATTSETTPGAAGGSGPAGQPHSAPTATSAERPAVLGGGEDSIRLFHGTGQSGLEGLGATGRGDIDVAHTGGAHQDLGQGFYLTTGHEAAEQYASSRARSDSRKNTSDKVLQHTMMFEVALAQLGRVVDVRPGGNFAAEWNAFLDRPFAGGLVPNMKTYRGAITFNADSRGEMFNEFLASIGQSNADTVIAPLGVEPFTGIGAGDQVCIRSQAVADSLNAMIRGNAP